MRAMLARYVRDGVARRAGARRARRKQPPLMQPHLSNWTVDRRDKREPKINPTERKPSLPGRPRSPKPYDDARLHLTHQAREAGDVDGEDRGETAGGVMAPAAPPCAGPPPRAR